LTIVQLAVDCLAAASLYALVALAVALSFSGSGMLNLAIGQVAIAGGLAAAAVTMNGGPVVLAVLLGLAVAGVLGAVAERSLVAPTLGRPLLGAVLLVAAGVVLRELLQGIFPRSAYAFPTTGGTLTVAGGIVHVADLLTIAVVAGVAAAGSIVLRTTSIGASVRLTASAPIAAERLGVDTALVRTTSFAVGGALAAAAVLLGAARFPIAAGGGITLAFRGLAAAVAGGMLSPAPVVVAATLIAAGQVVGGYFLGSGGEAVSDIVAVLLIAAGAWRWRR